MIQRAGDLNLNLIHAMSLAVARKADCDFMCNVTLDEERRVIGVFSGEMEAAHQKGIGWVDMSAKVAVVPAPIVVTTSAGFPLDITFYQCVKGIVCVLPALRRGGTLVIAAGLSEDIGGPEFSAMCRFLSTRGEFLERIFSSPTQINQWQLRELMLASKHAGQIFIVSDGVSPETLSTLLLTPMPGVEEALGVAREKHSFAARVVVIPEGPYVTTAAVQF